MNKLIAALALALLAAGMGQARAGELCGEQTHEKYGETRIHAGDFIATCRPDGSCAAVTYTKNDKAPLGWDNRLSIGRPSLEAPWIVQLTTVLGTADLTEGMLLTVDKNEAMAIPYEFLTKAKAVNDYDIDHRLTDPVLKQLLPGNKVTWEYAPKGGASGTATFSLRGLGKAMDWLACAQGKAGTQQ